MIFVTLGSQKFQFNRLLKEVDRLIAEGKIKEEVFAQIGYSDYEPKNYQYKAFLDRDEFIDIMNKCDKVITHGGTGAIISAVKEEKKVIAVPRLEKYGEHVDNHQMQIISQFEKMGIIEECYNIDDLERKIDIVKNKKYNKYVSNTFEIIKSLDDFFQSI